MTTHGMEPVTLHGSRASYFTGKMENYFRVKGVPHTFEAMQFPQAEKLNKQRVGVAQMPLVQLSDGRWMTDTTKMIEWFEAQTTDNPLLPSDPVQAFLCHLVEDYADEWLWRPAMHYRWHYPAGALLLSRLLVDETLGSLPLPGPLKRAMLRFRQRSGYTRGDGITTRSVPGVEAIYLRTLDQLQAIFEQRPFILGNSPSVADIGLSGPFFRHFGFDPVPLEIMRQRAPAVLEWVVRLWNHSPEKGMGDWVAGVPDDLGPLLKEIGEHYLPYLCANAEAVKAGRKRFDVDIGGVEYRGARYSRYRVWCLQQLRAQYEALPAPAAVSVEKLLRDHGCWEPLWRLDVLPLRSGEDDQLPFKAQNKMVGVNE